MYKRFWQGSVLKIYCSEMFQKFSQKSCVMHEIDLPPVTRIHVHVFLESE
jgi:hypothetical protein